MPAARLDHRLQTVVADWAGVVSERLAHTLGVLVVSSHLLEVTGFGMEGDLWTRDAFSACLRVVRSGVWCWCRDSRCCVLEVVLI